MSTLVDYLGGLAFFLLLILIFSGFMLAFIFVFHSESFFARNDWRILHKDGDRINWSKVDAGKFLTAMASKTFYYTAIFELIYLVVNSIFGEK